MATHMALGGDAYEVGVNKRGFFSLQENGEPINKVDLENLSNAEKETVNKILARAESAIKDKVPPEQREETWNELQQIWKKVNGEPKEYVQMPDSAVVSKKTEDTLTLIDTQIQGLDDTFTDFMAELKQEKPIKLSWLLFSGSGVP